MLEYLVIFARGGAILWTFGQLLNSKGSPIDTLIQTCLLEDRGGDTTYTYRAPDAPAYTLKWTLDNGLDLVFVAAYQQMLSLPYIDQLLASLKKEFAPIYKPGVFAYPQFDATFKRVLSIVEKRNMASKQRAQGRQNGHAAGQGTHGTGSSGADNAGDDNDAADADAAVGGADVARKTQAEQSDANGSAGSESTGSHSGFNVDALRKKTAGKSLGSRKSSGGRSAARKPVAAEAQKGKKPRNWGAPDADEAVDYSQAVADSGAAGAQDPAAATAQRSRMDARDTVDYDSDADDLLLQEESATEEKNGTRSALGGLLSTLKTSVVGKQALSADDVATAATVLQKRLQERNVSAEVASQVCASVSASLQGKKLASFTGVASLVRTAMEAALTRVLSPKRSIDILADIRASKARGVPYSIVFVGVNGVGKSTNLAKIAYWLRQQNVRVMIAACDTFRSGAVEQLKTHCNRLKVPLFDRGYDKDPTNVAAAAIAQAKRDGVDVVLVDTAGRMQDNEPLMRALSSLINRNRPDLVLFVGEALVGNDGVTQLVKFNQRLADLSPAGQNARLIDGILVTKFDAIDNKVGAVLSMAYTSGAPIMFVGCGQTYTDLKRLDVRTVVKALLK